jgi:hypothetical protein
MKLRFVSLIFSYDTQCFNKVGRIFLHTIKIVELVSKIIQNVVCN